MLNFVRLPSTGSGQIAKIRSAQLTVLLFGCLEKVGHVIVNARNGELEYQPSEIHVTADA